MKARKPFNLIRAIFLGLVLGILLGLFMPGRYDFLLPAVELLGGVYMNALRIMIFPLIFCSLIVSIHSIGSISATGRIVAQCALYFTGATLFARLLGLFLPKTLGDLACAVAMEQTVDLDPAKMADVSK